MAAPSLSATATQTCLRAFGLDGRGDGSLFRQHIASRCDQYVHRIALRERQRAPDIVAASRELADLTVAIGQDALGCFDARRSLGIVSAASLLLLVARLGREGIGRHQLAAGRGDEDSGHYKIQSQFHDADTPAAISSCPMTHQHLAGKMVSKWPKCGTRNFLLSHWNNLEINNMSKAPFKIKSLDHIVLRVRDRDRMVRFYCDILGCTMEREQAEIGLTQVRAGQSLIDLVPVDGKLGRMGGAAPGKEGRNLDHFCITLDGYDEAKIRTYLTAQGVEIGEAGSRYGAEGEGPSLYVSYPEGNVVELKGPPWNT